MTGNSDRQIEPQSYRGQERETRPEPDRPRSGPEPDPHGRFYANGVGSVTNSLEEAIESTRTHDFDEAVEIVEDALDDLEKLEEGPTDS